MFLRYSTPPNIIFNCYTFSSFKDPYGNYVVQYILDNFSFNESKTIYETVYHNMLKFSTQKFSSNVVEKCLIRGSFFLNIYLFYFILLTHVLFLFKYVYFTTLLRQPRYSI